MKFLFIVVTSILLSVNLYSQSTNLDKFYYNTESILLPSNYYPEQERLFYVNVTQNNTGVDFDVEKININGFKRVLESNLGIEIEISLPSGFKADEPQIVERVEIITDKNDNEKKIRFYKVKRKYNYGGFNYAKIKDLKSTLSLSYGLEYETSEYSSSQEAVDYYNLKRRDWDEDFKKQVVSHNYYKINRFFNELIGYPIYNQEVKLWLLGNKKNPEYEKHQEALEIIKNSFKDVKYNYLPEDIDEKIKPAILIFEELLQKYVGNDKKNKKVRYSSYYNLMKIYYCIDDFDKAIKYANLLIDNGYDKKDGDKMLELISKRKENMALNKVNSLHFEIQNFKEYSISNSL
ncbi:hypothetical protein ETU10_01055 [Apibacter muscae]|uniref:hypothetical protein n=1 Tax=Apibacter muscae TaxID=2509004 RepID=UPI0011AD5B02|nr:hypothetical protein [Apibacter muscae]TWP25252.1 hypothetical protein ETU10_01055 [Apibacter muscae]